MSELALAMFAAARGVHAVDGERAGRGFGEFARRFDGPAELRRLADAGLRWVPRSDPSFPGRLGSIHDPPPGLFLRGAAEPELLGRASVAIVGARSCTDYGAHVARTLARELAEAGLGVISGLARGVDGWAHRGSLERGGAAIAVLGCGIDRDYPRAHAALAAQIAEVGLVVSEYPPGVPPAPWRFPARNRLVAGLAVATIVVEARERSGALITADLALEEGRDVLAVPGEITSALSAGTNALIRLGATPVTCADDVLAAIGLERAPQAPELARTGSTAAVLTRLADGPLTVDQIVRATGLTTAIVAAELVALELDGTIGASAGVYRRFGSTGDGGARGP